MSILQSLKKAATLEDLASLLGYKPAGLSYIIYRMGDSSKYEEFQIPKKAGGLRNISAPKAKLKLLQRRLANVLYACCYEIEKARPQRPLSHGFRRGRSIVTNARRHKRRRFVLNLDLDNFFPTFNFGRVRGFFIKNRDFELSEKIATIIAQIACKQNSLPQGSPCSPIISDLIGHLLDVRLAQMARVTCPVSSDRV